MHNPKAGGGANKTGTHTSGGGVVTGELGVGREWRAENAGALSPMGTGFSLLESPVTDIEAESSNMVCSHVEPVASM